MALQLPHYEHGQRAKILGIDYSGQLKAKDKAAKAKCLCDKLAESLPDILSHVNVEPSAHQRKHFVLVIGKGPSATRFPPMYLPDLKRKLKSLLDEAAEAQAEAANGQGQDIQRDDLPLQYQHAQEAAAQAFRSFAAKLTLFELRRTVQLLTADAALERKQQLAALLAGAAAMVKKAVNNVLTGEKGRVVGIAAVSNSGKSFVTSVIMMYLTFVKWAYENHPYPDDMRLLYREALIHLSNGTGQGLEEAPEQPIQGSTEPVRVAMPPTYGLQQQGEPVQALDMFSRALSTYCEEAKATGFRPSIPASFSELQGTTQRVMPLEWAHYLHILVEFEDERTLKAACTEFLTLLATWIDEEALKEAKKCAEGAKEKAVQNKKQKLINDLLQAAKEHRLKKALKRTFQLTAQKRVACFGRYLALCGDQLPVHEDASGELSIITDADKISLHQDVLQAVNLRALIFHGPVRPPPGARGDEREHQQELLDQLLLWVADVLSWLNMPCPIENDVSDLVKSSQERLKSCLPQQLHQIQDAWRLLAAMKENSPVLYGPFEALANGSHALDMPGGQVHDAQQMAALDKALREVVTSLAFMTPEPHKTDMLPFLGRTYLPRLMNWHLGRIEQPNKADWGSMPAFNMLFYPEKNIRAVGPLDGERMSLNVMQKYLSKLKVMDNRALSILQESYKDGLMDDWGEAWKEDKLKEAPEAENRITAAQKRVEEPGAHAIYPTLQASMMLNRRHVAECKSTQDKEMATVQEVMDYIDTGPVLRDLFSLPRECLVEIVAQLRDSLQAELNLLNDRQGDESVVQQDASGSAKKIVDNLKNACQPAMQQVETWCGRDSTLIHQLGELFTQNTQLVLQSEEKLRESVTAALEACEAEVKKHKKGANITYEDIISCLLPSLQGRHPDLNVHQLMHDWLGLDQVISSVMQCVKEQEQQFSAVVAGLLADAAMSSVDMPSTNQAWIRSALTSHISTRLLDEATHKLYAYNKKGFSDSTLRTMFSIAIRTMLQKVLKAMMAWLRDQSKKNVRLDLQAISEKFTKQLFTQAPAIQEQTWCNSCLAATQQCNPFAALQKCMEAKVQSLARELLPAVHDQLGDGKVKAVARWRGVANQKAVLLQLFYAAKVHLDGLLKDAQDERSLKTVVGLLQKAIGNVERLLATLNSPDQLRASSQSTDNYMNLAATCTGVVLSSDWQDKLASSTKESPKIWLKTLRAPPRMPARRETRQAARQVNDYAHQLLEETFLQPNNVHRVKNRADGNCMLESALQACYGKDKLPEDEEVLQLRKKAVQVLTNLYVTAGGDSDFRAQVGAELQAAKYEDITDWYTAMRQDRTWGDGLLLVGIAHALKACLVVHSVRLDTPLVVAPEPAAGQELPVLVLVHVNADGSGEPNHYEACLQPPLGQDNAPTAREQQQQRGKEYHEHDGETDGEGESEVQQPGAAEGSDADMDVGSVGDWQPNMQAEATQTQAKSEGKGERPAKRPRTDSCSQGSLTFPTTPRYQFVLDGSLVWQEPEELPLLRLVLEHLRESEHRVVVPQQLANGCRPRAGPPRSPTAPKYGLPALREFIFLDDTKARADLVESTCSWDLLHRVGFTEKKAYDCMGLQAARSVDTLGIAGRTRSQPNVCILIVSKHWIGYDWIEKTARRGSQAGQEPHVWVVQLQHLVAWANGEDGLQDVLRRCTGHHVRQESHGNKVFRFKYMP